MESYGVGGQQLLLGCEVKLITPLDGESTQYASVDWLLDNVLLVSYLLKTLTHQGAYFKVNMK